jgi:hypothetical protein
MFPFELRADVSQESKTSVVMVEEASVIADGIGYTKVWGLLNAAQEAAEPVTRTLVSFDIDRSETLFFADRTDVDALADAHASYEERRKKARMAESANWEWGF